MGCTSSTNIHTKNQQPISKVKKKSKELLEDSHDLDENELHKKKEDILLRHDSEVDIMQQISAERETLKSVCSIKIANRLAYEDFLDSLSASEFVEMLDREKYIKLQKLFMVKAIKQEISHKVRSWILYNNLEAINDIQMHSVAKFFILLFKGMHREKLHSLAGLNDKSRSDSIDKGLNNVAISKHIANKAEQERMEKSLRAIPIVTIAPLHHYRLSILTLYDYELPPGIITMNEVKLVIELFRNGGKLITKSVHKILRLGYKILKERKNITNITIEKNERLTVVGDIHGQLADLLHILDANGLPSSNNKYIFNGDFVDRGEFGIEVVCILLSMLVARPDCVFLNRGNHEDFAICSVYGFQQECYEKYDPITFGLVVEVFQQIPLFSIVNSEVFVVHGGLFHATDVNINDLESIERTLFSLEDMPEGGETLQPFPRFQKQEFLSQLVRDALWSDPVDEHGTRESIRGAGVGFGPDITTHFLNNNGLKMVVRSHECIRSGYDEPYSSTVIPNTAAAPVLCTIFSASDYGGCGNSAAYLVFEMKNDEKLTEIEMTLNESMKIVSSSGKLVQSEPIKSTNENTSEIKCIQDSLLYYAVHYFYATPLKFSGNLASASLPYDNLNDTISADENTSRNTLYNGNLNSDAVPDISIFSKDVPSGRLKQQTELHRLDGAPEDTVVISSAIKLEDLIVARKHLIAEKCSQFDISQEGFIYQKEWLQVMSEVLNISVSWKVLFKYFMNEEYCIVGDNVDGHLIKIKYEDFLDKFLDEITIMQKEKTKEVEDFSAGVLERYNNSSTSSTAGSNNTKDDKDAKSSLDEEKTSQNDVIVTNSDVHVDFSNGTNKCDASKERYFGYSNINEEIIKILYSNISQLESAFSCLDHNDDGFISFEDTLRVFQQFGFVGTEEVASVPSGSNGLPPRRIGRDLSGSDVSKQTATLSNPQQLEDVFKVMDIYGCDQIDKNLFFEMFRLSILTTSGVYAEEASMKPNFAREMSFSQEVHRLSHSNPTPVNGNNFNHNAQFALHSTLSSIELKKGLEIGVDTELTMSRDHHDSSVGLSIDI